MSLNALHREEFRERYHDERVDLWARPSHQPTVRDPPRLDVWSRLLPDLHRSRSYMPLYARPPFINLAALGFQTFLATLYHKPKPLGVVETAEKVALAAE